jgi:UDP-hydrolysing UDP-N-acetyl-D-glucosamine 2-epimerase
VTRVCVVVTARPSYSRVKTVLQALLARGVDLQLVVLASAVTVRTGDVARYIEEPITEVLETQLESHTGVGAAKTMGLSLIDLSSTFARLMPELVMVIADRTETLAVSMAARLQHIPVCHLQGGEHTGMIDDVVRWQNTLAADYHCVSNQSAKNDIDTVLRGAWRPTAHVYVTGCPSIDLCVGLPTVTDLTPYGGVGDDPHLAPGYVVVLQHPEDEPAEAEAQMLALLQAVAAVNRQVVGIWPNADAGSDGTSKAIRRAGLALPRSMWFRTLPPTVFLSVLQGAGCLVGNSSVAVREAAFLGTPVVLTGRRQAGRDSSHCVAWVEAYDAAAIGEAIQLALLAAPVPGVCCDTYGNGTAGQQIAERVVAW